MGGGRCRSTPCWPPYRIFTIHLEKTKLSVGLAPDQETQGKVSRSGDGGELIQPANGVDGADEI